MMLNTGSFNFDLEKVSFVNKLGVLQKATSDDDTAIPGYLYQEIRDITLESLVFSECTVEYLSERLQKNSPHVKLKVLKLMKYLVDKSSRNFRLGLIKNSKGITNAKKFSGPPDPLHGNVPYIAVRKAAQDLSETLFDTESDVKSNSNDRTETKSSNFTGYGSSGTSKGRFEGFGNTQTQAKKTLGENFLSSVTRLAERLTEPEENPHNELLSSISNIGGYEPPKNCVQVSTPLFDKEQPLLSSTRDEIKPHIPGKAGGGWDDEDDDDDKIKDDQYSGERSSERQRNHHGDISNRFEGINMEDLGNEQNLVMNTVDNGEGFLLTLDQIKAFINACAELNCDTIAELLQSRLASSNENIVMRSLLLVEHLLMTDLVTPEKVLRECSQNLQCVVRTMEGQAVSKARKILKILEKLTENNENIDNPT